MRWYIGIPVKLAFFLALCAFSTFASYQFLSKGITVKIPDIRGKSLQGRLLLTGRLSRSG